MVAVESDDKDTQLHREELLALCPDREAEILAMDADQVESEWIDVMTEDVEWQT
jgi:hypothetical protein